jgi:hypothetical protein
MNTLPLPKVIGVSGFAGSGKDSFANIFVEKYGYTKISMADSIKDMLSVVFGWDREMLQGATPESRLWRETPDEFWSGVLEYPFTPRKAMTTIGTNLFRVHFHKDIWVQSVKKKILDVGTNVIIPDLRFGNEIGMMREIGACLFEIERGERPEWYQRASKENVMLLDGILPETNESMEFLYPEVHESEYRWIGLNKPCVLVDNSGSLQDLQKYVSRIYVN